jgi:hypothetical protein
VAGGGLCLLAGAVARRQLGLRQREVPERNACPTPAGSDSGVKSVIR